MHFFSFTHAFSYIKIILSIYFLFYYIHNLATTKGYLSISSALEIQSCLIKARRPFREKSRRIISTKGYDYELGVGIIRRQYSSKRGPGIEPGKIRSAGERSTIVPSSHTH